MIAGNTLTTDPTAATAVHVLDDRFIPLRAADLVTALAGDHERFGPESEWLRDVAAALADTLDRDVSRLGRSVIEQYVHFSPDRDTYPLCDVDRFRTPDGYALLDRQLAHLLEKANFEQLSDAQIDAAIRTANSFGLQVRLNPQRITSLSVWVRGRARSDRRIRSWRAPLRGRLRRLEIYRRLVVVARLRDDPHVHVKVFKEIPTADLEALLPHAEVHMTWFDRVLLLGGGAGTIGTTAAKAAAGAKWAFNIAVIVAALGQLVWVIIGGLLLLTFRTVMGYRRARNHRDSQRTRHLYYQNISNNLGAIGTLISMIGQEEEKEAVLAYAFCHAADPPIRSPQDLHDRVNEYLRRRFALRVDFDAADAVRTLATLGLWRDPPEAGALTVLPPDAALQRLNERAVQPRVERSAALAPG